MAPFPIASIKFRSNERICTVLNAYFGNVNSSLDRIGHINLSKCTKNSSTNKIEIEVESFGNQRLSCKSISSIVFDFSDIKLWEILKDSYRMEEAQVFVYALFYRLGFQIYYSLNYDRSSRYSRLRFTGQISAETCLYE